MVYSPMPSPTRKTSGWSPERRARHAQAIRRWAPWANSTGPRTRAGKARSSRNAYKHGRRAFDPVRAVLANQKRLHHEIATNELLNSGRYPLLDGAVEGGLRLMLALITPSIMQKPCILGPPEGKS